MTVTPETSSPLNKVRELPAGDKITGFYLLTKLETRQKKDGVPYLVCHLQDSTAMMEAILWEEFVDLLASVAVGDVLKIEATVDRYRDVPRLHVVRARKATPEEAPDRRPFLPHSSLSAEQAHAALGEIIAAIGSPHLRALLLSVFGDGELLDLFLRAPGGKLWHHATVGGLAEHTVSLARLARSISQHYSELNGDLLVAGALLHDVGKVRELSADVAIDYSTEGRLLGHIVQGALLVEGKMALLADFPQEMRRQLLHLILSHQGDGSMGSPVKPMTREALALHYLDELDSRLDAFARVRAATPEGHEFSEYVRLMDRFFYLKPVEDRPEKEADTAHE